MVKSLIGPIDLYLEVINSQHRAALLAPIPHRPENLARRPDTESAVERATASRADYFVGQIENAEEPRARGRQISPLNKSF